ncbi:MAG: heavy metal translocating P-type ATPase [Lachnospiraceae bacterium]|nr:heavy metal translocating P-type ATPase [Lachnospiraceae bacterium]
MSCAACSARVEKAVSSVPGVSSCAVSLLTNSMSVDGSAEDAAVIKAVESAGYGAAVKTEEVLDEGISRGIKLRLAVSVMLLLILMYFSMGVHMFGWPLPKALMDHMGLIQLILSGLIMIVNNAYFVRGFRSLAKLSPNMDSLIALGCTASYVYSVAMVIAKSHELYFESAGMILTLVTVGKTLEAYSKGRTTDAIKSLMKLAPKTANVIRDGREVTVDIEEVRVGDIFTVRPGENIPVDGTVIEGSSAVDESALTGESIPVDKEEGSTVCSATINRSGFLKCRATRVGEDTTLSEIISLMSSAAATKAPAAKLADRISGVFVPAVILIALLAFAAWMLLGQSLGYALARGVSVLVVSCPCALGLATPVAIMVGNGNGARGGILFKTARALQETGSVKIVALDKTGTITQGMPKVTDVTPADGTDEEKLIRIAASLESRSEHPLAKAIMEYAGEKGIEAADMTDFTALAGNGLEAVIGGKHICGGSVAFIRTGAEITQEAEALAIRASEEGKTPVMFAEDGKLLGMFAIADTIKEDSAEAVRQLKNMGIYTVMLTGDNQRTADAIGRAAGVDRVIAQVLPDRKEMVIRSLEKSGRTAMVGDGINDAPALARADIGMAIGAGTDVAIDAADVVLMRSRLTDVAAAVRLSRRTLVNIKENLFWALIYNVLLIPLACGLYSRWGLIMSPAWGAAAMSCSSIFVVSNALRLNLYRIHDSSGDRAGKRVIPEEYEEEKGAKEMKKTVKIEGMMCSHCEANVKKALEAAEGVMSADVSHEAGTAVIELADGIDEALIRKTIEDAGYKFVSME